MVYNRQGADVIGLFGKVCLHSKNLGFSKNLDFVKTNFPF